MTYVNDTALAAMERRHARMLAALIFLTGLCAGATVVGTYVELAWYLAH